MNGSPSKSSAGSSFRKAATVVPGHSVPAWIDAIAAGGRNSAPPPVAAPRVCAGLVLRSVLRHPPVIAKGSPHVPRAR
jgi:hypothetical protein